MADKKNPLGPTGEHVRANVARLRGRTQYKELAERLSALGRPIPPLGLRRIEAGERRVDADDLMALAVALGVPPNSLLLPHSDPSPAPAATAVGGEVKFQDLWAWADGVAPLSGRSDETDSQRVQRRELSRPALLSHQAGPDLKNLLETLEALTASIAVSQDEVARSGDD